jgi:hypothetical protein
MILWATPSCKQDRPHASPCHRHPPETLRPHLGLSKDRVETLALIVVAMVSARTVNLSHLAAERPGSALIRRLLRSDPLQAAAPWLRITQKTLKNTEVV